MEGIDTWHKLILSSNIGFGISVEPDSVPVSGIRNIRAADVANFTAHGLVCKLISTGKYENGKLSAYVQPALFDKSEPEAAVPANYNLITFVGSASDRMSFYGQGAGRYPTAYNVLQDCMDIIAGKGFYCTYGAGVKAENDETAVYYVSGAADAWLEENRQETWGDAMITKPVAVADMHRWVKEHEAAFIAAVN